MSIDMYQTSIPVFVKMLGNLSAILEKGDAHAKAKNIDPSVFINYRLAPDMYPLSKQVQIATDMAKGCAARLARLEVPAMKTMKPRLPTYKRALPRPSLLSKA